MKRFLVVVIIAVFFCSTSFAQSNHRLGFVFGPNHFSLRGNSIVDDTKGGNGLFYGFSYEYKFNKNWSIETGITLDQKVVNYNSEFTSSYFNDQGVFTTENFTVKTKNRYKYFSVPIMLKYKFGKKSTFFTNGGLFIANSKTNKKSTTITNVTNGYSYNITTTRQYNFPNADDIDGYDYGVSLGFGKSFKLNSKTDFSLELRDNFGIGSVVSMGDEKGVKTNTLNLITQLSFDL